MKRSLMVLACVWIATGAASCLAQTVVNLASDIQTPLGRDQERQRIEAERSALNAKFDAADAECKTRFIVTSCVNDVKRQRNVQLDELKRQENILNRLDNKAAAIKEQQKIEENVSDKTLADKEKDKQDALGKYAKKESDRADRAAERGEKASAKTPQSKPQEKTAEKSTQDKAQKRADYEQKQRDLLERRKRRDDNIRENEQKKKDKALEREKAAEKAKAAASSPKPTFL